MKTEQKNCLICQRIKLIEQGKNPFFIKKFETGYAVLGDHQYFKGYCLFLCKIHKIELHELDKKFKMKFLEEMSVLAEAVYKTFKPAKLNYELLGNTDRHLHWHIFPRYKQEKNLRAPVWMTNKRVRNAKRYILQEKERKRLIAEIRKNIEVPE